MRRSIFLLPVIIAAGFYSACTESPSPQLRLSCPALPAIQVLHPSYSPLKNPYSPPTDSSNIQQNYQLRSEISNDLSQAFSNAPQKVKDDLCGLTGIFIDSKSCFNGDVNNCQNVNNAFPVS